PQIALVLPRSLRAVGGEVVLQTLLDEVAGLRIEPGIAGEHVVEGGPIFIGEILARLKPGQRPLLAACYTVSRHPSCEVVSLLLGHAFLSLSCPSLSTDVRLFDEGWVVASATLGLLKRNGRRGLAIGVFSAVRMIGQGHTC